VPSSSDSKLGSLEIWWLIMLPCLAFVIVVGTATETGWLEAIGYFGVFFAAAMSWRVAFDLVKQLQSTVFGSRADPTKVETDEP
jgi:hypothetical protein